MKVVVTGGAGFIGSNLVRKLIKRDDIDRIIIIDDLSTGNIENISRDKKIVFWKKDINGTFDLYNIDVAFHLAALPRVQFSFKYPFLTNESNLTGTISLLDKTKRFNVKKFIFSSSSSVYGDQEMSLLMEDMPPNPMSPYAFQKMSGEYYCKLYNDHFGLKTVGLRYFNVFGPGQDPNGDYATLIPKFIDSTLKNERFTINGDGNQTRDFTYIDDVVDANIYFGLVYDGDFGFNINVGSGVDRSVNEIINEIGNKIKGQLNINPDVVHGPSIIEPRNTCADIKKLTKLGFELKSDFESSLNKTIESYINDK